MTLPDVPEIPQIGAKLVDFKMRTDCYLGQCLSSASEILIIRTSDVEAVVRNFQFMSQL